MPRAAWKGFLRLSLVGCPVCLIRATTKTRSIRLRQVWVPRDEPAAEPEFDDDEPPVRSLSRRRHAASARAPKAPDDRTRWVRRRGSRYSKCRATPARPSSASRSAEATTTRGQFVTFTADEMKAFEVESSHTIDLSTFVPRAEVDPAYLNVPYYAYPDGAVAARINRPVVSFRAGRQIPH